jgi:hypothetical protein
MADGDEALRAYYAREITDIICTRYDVAGIIFDALVCLSVVLGGVLLVRRLSRGL